MKQLLVVVAILLSGCAARSTPISPSVNPSAKIQDTERRRYNTKVIDTLTRVMSGETPEQGPLTNSDNLSVRTDANGYLMASGQVYTAPDGPLTNFGNIRVRTDSNGYLMVAFAGGTVTAPLTVAANNITTTSTDGAILNNATASTVGVPTQYSPRLKFCGTAWNSVGAASETDCWIIENRPATNAGATTQTLTFSESLAGAAYTNLGGIDSLGTWNMQQFSAANTSYVGWNGRSRLYSTGDSLVNVMNSGNTFGLQLNAGTAATTVTACGTGAITVPSRNGNGAFTATGATACTVTFAAGTWANTPRCVITATKVPTTFPYISAISTSSFTVNGMTAGDNLTVNYICEGAI